MSPIRILLVDDQLLMLDGLKTIIGLQQNMTVVGTACNGIEALEFLETNVVDLILMDVRMPQMNGVDCTREIKKMHPEIHVIMLTTFDDDEYIIPALTYGASGYLLKDIDGEHLIHAILQALTGHLLLPGKIAQKLARSLSAQTMEKQAFMQPTFDVFTEREREIIHWLIQGASSQEISKKLFLSQGTIKNYISNIYGKIGTNDRTLAAIRLKEMMDQTVDL